MKIKVQELCTACMAMSQNGPGRGRKAPRRPGAEASLYEVANSCQRTYWKSTAQKQQKLLLRAANGPTVDELPMCMRHHLWNANVLRQYGRADAEISWIRRKPPGPKELIGKIGKRVASTGMYTATR